MLHEADLSAIKKETKNEARVSFAYENSHWTQRLEKKASKRSCTAHPRMTAENLIFPKSSRLKKVQDFQQVIRQSSSLRAKGVGLFFRKGEGVSSRLGIVISKRQVKRAVDRNKFKRMIREFYRLNQPKFGSTYDIVVRIVDGPRVTPENLRVTLEQLFKKTEILK